MRVDSDYRPRQKPAANHGIFWLIALVVLAAGAAIFVLMRDKGTPEHAQVEIPVAPAPPAARPDVAPEIRYPVPDTSPEAAPEAPPVPPLNESDPVMLGSLARLFGQESLSQFLIPEGIIRRMVATIDNLPREKVAVRVKPVSPIAGKFLATGPEGDFTLNPDNYARYTTFIRLVQAADTGQLAAVYFHFYPLFQEAYEELGFPGRYFNDRLIEVIDHLLETPDVQGPIKLVRPRVFYQFADADLEVRSAGQKALIRMGRDNAVIIKAKLYDVRRAVTGKTPKQ